MHRSRWAAATIAVVAAAGMLVGTATTASAAAPSGTMHASQQTKLSSAPFVRAKISYGARDDGPYHINHVLELQYRLKWVGLYHLAPTGYFGGVTRNAVKAFQKRHHLPVTGVVNVKTWQVLISHTLRDIKDTPAVCKTAGWHACYDRHVHAVNLWHDGVVYNSWLVRGGASDMQTRVGTHKVYYRDIDHVSGEFGSAMPYSQFFDGGEALHGSPFMTNPFVGHSHGCVNMYIKDAHVLWNLTSKVTLWVTVYGSWS